MKQKQTYLKIQTKDGKKFEYTVLTEQGRIEKEVDELMKIIKSHAYRLKYDSVAVDKWRQENKIGEYREWEFDAKRIEEIQQQVKDGDAHMWPTIASKYDKKNSKPGAFGSRGTYNTTKKQLKEEQEQLIHELNNG
jgi:anti-sigma28 factor (negative regulator of flagellin synthesis)